MRIYETVDALSEAIGLPSSPDRWDESELGGFGSESDWGWRLRGQGLPGGLQAGWLLTRAASYELDDGHLIAYALIDGKKTGRCALLRSPWPHDLDARELDRIRATEWWHNAGALITGGEADLDEVDGFLAGDVL